MNLHLLPIFKNLAAYDSKKFPWSINKKIYKYKKGDCPVAENMNEKYYLSINMWKYDYTDSNIKFIIENFKNVWSSLAFKRN